MNNFQAPTTASSLALLRKLEWRVRHTADTILGGEYRSAFRGRGREFDQVVRHEYGDDVRDIDWNVTARRGELYRKKFIEERELTTLLLFDDSLSLQFGSGERSKRETLLEMASLFALLSATNRDRTGFWHATPQREYVRQPVRGRTAILTTAANLLGQPVPDLELGGEVQIDWKLFFHSFPRHTLVIWLGDFAPRALPPGWSALRRRYEMVGVRVDDPWDRELPRRGVFAAFDPERGELLPFDSETRANRQRHAAWKEEREAHWNELFPSPAQRLVVSTQEDGLDALVRFFRTRMHQIRL